MFHKLAILDYYESLCRRVDIFTEEKNEKLEKCKDRVDFINILPRIGLDPDGPFKSCDEQIEEANQDRNLFINLIEKTQKEAIDRFTKPPPLTSPKEDQLCFMIGNKSIMLCVVDTFLNEISDKPFDKVFAESTHCDYRLLLITLDFCPTTEEEKQLGSLIHNKHHTSLSCAKDIYLYYTAKLIRRALIKLDQIKILHFDSSGFDSITRVIRLDCMLPKNTINYDSPKYTFNGCYELDVRIIDARFIDHEYKKDLREFQKITSFPNLCDLTLDFGPMFIYVDDSILTCVPRLTSLSLKSVSFKRATDHFFKNLGSLLSLYLDTALDISHLTFSFLSKLERIGILNSDTEGIKFDANLNINSLLFRPRINNDVSKTQKNPLQDLLPRFHYLGELILDHIDIPFLTSNLYSIPSYTPHLKNFVIDFSHKFKLVEDIAFLMSNTCNIDLEPVTHSLFNGGLAYLEKFEILNVWLRLSIDFSHLENLTSLDLSGCFRLVIKVNMFNKLVNLKKLGLHKVRLKSEHLEQGLLFKLKNLQSLDLSYNPLVYLNKVMFSQCINLQEVSFFYNDTQDWAPDTFDGFDSIKVKVEWDVYDTNKSCQICLKNISKEFNEITVT